MAKEIYVMLPKGMKGEIITQTTGFPGNQCQVATKPYIEALGGKIVSDEEVLEGRADAAQEKVLVH